MKFAGVVVQVVICQKGVPCVFSSLSCSVQPSHLSLLFIQVVLINYGYNFALALIVTIATGMALLDNDLDRLEYETFMLQ